MLDQVFIRIGIIKIYFELHFFLSHFVIFGCLFIQKTIQQLLRLTVSITAVYIAMMKKLQVLNSYFIENIQSTHCSDNADDYLTGLNKIFLSISIRIEMDKKLGNFTVTEYEI